MDIVARAKGMLLDPRKEWQTIAAEEPQTGQLFSSYVLPLVLIPSIASFIGWGFFGSGLVGSLTLGLAMAVIAFLGAVISVYLAAVVTQVLAPHFASQGNLGRALQLVAFSFTPAWVLGIFNIIPGLSWLPLIGAIWSLYLLYLGLPPIMKTPPDKVVPYMIVMIVVVIAVYVVVGAILTRLFLPLFGFHPGVLWHGGF
jgi:hypothetical protein